MVKLKVVEETHSVEIDFKITMPLPSGTFILSSMRRMISWIVFEIDGFIDKV